MKIINEIRFDEYDLESIKIVNKIVDDICQKYNYKKYDYNSQIIIEELIKYDLLRDYISNIKEINDLELTSEISLAIRNFNNIHHGLCNRIYENDFDISRLDVIEFLFDYVSGKTEYFYGIDIKIVKAKKNNGEMDI